MEAGNKNGHKWNKVNTSFFHKSLDKEMHKKKFLVLGAPDAVPQWEKKLHNPVHWGYRTAYLHKTDFTILSRAGLENGSIM